MNRATIIGIVIRHGLSAAGALLAARGMISSEQVSQADAAAEAFTGGMMVLVGIGLSAWQKHQARQIATPHEPKE